MPTLTLDISSDPASDSWGFVGVVRMDGLTVFRTLESFPTPELANEATRTLVADALGQLLAGAEWSRRRVRSGRVPTRRDYQLTTLRARPEGRHAPYD